MIEIEAEAPEGIWLQGTKDGQAAQMWVAAPSSMQAADETRALLNGDGPLMWVSVDDAILLAEQMTTIDASGHWRIRSSKNAAPTLEDVAQSDPTLTTGPDDAERASMLISKADGMRLASLINEKLL